MIPIEQRVQFLERYFLRRHAAAHLDKLSVVEYLHINQAQERAIVELARQRKPVQRLLP